MSDQNIPRGSVYRDGDGWRAELRWTDGNGNQQRRTRRAATRKQAYQYLGDLRTSAAAGLAVAAGDITVEQLLFDWHRHGAASQAWKPGTAEQYRKTINNHIIPRIGQLRLRALGTREVRN